MPNFDIIRESNVETTFRVKAVQGKFDLDSKNIKERFTGNIDLPKEWQIGLIVGNSGTGKTTIAKELFENAYITNFEYSNNAIVDDMPKGNSVEDITKAFNSVGFSSPPSWLKPYSVLSNGEKMRVDLARAMLSENEMFVFDEFTSVVDRNVAKIGSFAMQKAIRKTNKQFIAISPHFDIQDWLMPDWIFYTNDMTFQTFEKQKKNRPSLDFRIYETKEKSKYWKMFARYHYLSPSHNNAARVFVATINDEVAGFISVFHFPHPQIKNMKKVHRLVVLPDYQGAGFGIRMLNFIGDLYRKEKQRYTITTSAPSLIYALKKDDRWRCSFKGRITGGAQGTVHNREIKGTGSSNRITTSWEYLT